MEERSLKQVDLVQLASERGHKLGKSQLSQYLSGKTEPRPEMSCPNCSGCPQTG